MRCPADLPQYSTEGFGHRDAKPAEKVPMSVPVDHHFDDAELSRIDQHAVDAGINLWARSGEA